MVQGCVINNNGLKKKTSFYICDYFYMTSVWNSANKTEEEYTVSSNNITM